MNYQVLGMWITLASAIHAMIFLIAWTATGRRHTPLRVAAGICAIIMGLSFLYWRFIY
jgi:hypothetical protein